MLPLRAIEAEEHRLTIVLGSRLSGRFVSLSGALFAMAQSERAQTQLEGMAAEGLFSRHTLLSATSLGPLTTSTPPVFPASAMKASVAPEALSEMRRVSSGESLARRFLAIGLPRDTRRSEGNQPRSCQLEYS